MVMSISHRVSFIARMLSVVHAIHPEPASSSTASSLLRSLLEASKSSMRKGMSCTPIENKGLRRCVEVEVGRISVTDKGILESTEIL
jgi:hypothetical protein